MYSDQGKSSSTKAGLIIGGILLFVILGSAGVGGYFYFKKESSAQTSATSANLASTSAGTSQITQATNPNTPAVIVASSIGEPEKPADGQGDKQDPKENAEESKKVQAAISEAEFDQLFSVISEKLKASKDARHFEITSTCGKVANQFSGGFDCVRMHFFNGDDERAILKGEKDLLEAWAAGTVHINGWGNTYYELEKFQKLLETVSGKEGLNQLTKDKVKDIIEKRYAMITDEEKKEFFLPEKPFAWSIAVRVKADEYEEIFATPETVVNKEGAVEVYEREQGDTNRNVISLNVPDLSGIVGKIFYKMKNKYFIGSDHIKMKPEGWVSEPLKLEENLYKFLRRKH